MKEGVNRFSNIKDLQRQMARRRHQTTRIRKAIIYSNGKSV